MDINGRYCSWALLTQLDSLVNEAQAGYWHYFLYFFATCFIIINSWIQTAWGALVLYWPISVESSIILFFGNLSCSIAALSITKPVRWYGCVALVILFSVLMQFFFMKQHGWTSLPLKAVERAKTGIYIYIGLIVIIVMIMLLMLKFHKRLFEILFGILTNFFSSLALFWQHQGMKKEKIDMGIS